MATPAFGNPDDDPERKREDASALSAGQAEDLDRLAQALGLASPPKPVTAEVEGPPDRGLTAGGRKE
jgi:hypothetical protein